MKTSFLTNIDVERRALAHRRALGFVDDQAIDMMTLITKLKHRYASSGFGYRKVPDGSLGEAEAQWDSDTKTILIPMSVYVAGNSGQERALFSIVHEVGHALLGHKGLLNRAPSGNNAERISLRIRSMEREARRYAASFLIPNTPIVRATSVEQICQKYCVSRDTAMIWKREHI
jgi:hypothetical protein